MSFVIFGHQIWDLEWEGGGFKLTPLGNPGLQVRN